MFHSDKNWLAEGLSFIPVDPTGALVLEPMTTKCQIGGKDDNQEIKVTQNLQQVEPNCATCTPIWTPYSYTATPDGRDFPVPPVGGGSIVIPFNHLIN